MPAVRSRGTATPATDYHRESSAVAIAHRVEPAHGLDFRIPWRRQQPVDNPLIRVRGIVGQKRLHLGRRRWNPGKVQRDSPEQGPPIRFRRRREPLSQQTFGMNASIGLRIGKFPAVTPGTGGRFTGSYDQCFSYAALRPPSGG